MAFFLLFFYQKTSCFFGGNAFLVCVFEMMERQREEGLKQWETLEVHWYNNMHPNQEFFALKTSRNLNELNFTNLISK